MLINNNEIKNEKMKKKITHTHTQAQQIYMKQNYKKYKTHMHALNYVLTNGLKKGEKITLGITIIITVLYPSQ